jgi:hypothetical protein
MKMRLILIILAITLSRLSEIGAKEPSYGEYSVYLLKLAKGVRTLGLGGAGVALDDSYDVVYSNPAGVANLNTVAIEGSYVSWFRGLDINITQILLSQPLTPNNKRRNFTLTSNYLSSSVEEATAEGKRTGKNKGVSSLILGLSLAEKYTKDLYLGSTLELIRENLGVDIGEGFALNVGVLHQYTPQVNVGCAIRHLGPKIKLGRNKYPLPRTISIGIATKPKVLEKRMLFVCDLDKDKSGFCLKCGAEYSLLPILLIRIGYNTTSGTSLGFSIYSKGEGSYGKLSAYFNYAWLLQHRTELGYSSHHLSICFLF